MSRFSINRNRFLKEFIMQNPPDFPISNKCCEYAKSSRQRNLSKKQMPILKLQVYESLRAVSDLPITRLVSPTANQKAVIHTDQYFGIRMLTRRFMKKTLIFSIHGAIPNTD